MALKKYRTGRMQFRNGKFRVLHPGRINCTNTEWSEILKSKTWECRKLQAEPEVLHCHDIKNPRTVSSSSSTVWIILGSHHFPQNCIVTQASRETCSISSNSKGNKKWESNYFFKKSIINIRCHSRGFRSKITSASLCTNHFSPFSALSLFLRSQRIVLRT